jgi:hypothetical protein
VKRTTPIKEPAAPLKFCTTCKHYLPLKQECASPLNGLSLVTGMYRVLPAAQNRAATAAGRGQLATDCGNLGNWHEEKAAP